MDTGNQHHQMGPHHFTTKPSQLTVINNSSIPVAVGVGHVTVTNGTVSIIQVRVHKIVIPEIPTFGQNDEEPTESEEQDEEKKDEVEEEEEQYDDEE